MKFYKIVIFTCLFLFGAQQLPAQLAPFMYWVQFTDKLGTPYSLDKPTDFLSERAVLRREKQNIPISADDLPVNPVYVDSLRKLGLSIHNTSKWLNGAVVVSANEALLDTLHYLSFVAQPVERGRTGESKTTTEKFCLNPKSAGDYGFSKAQIEILKGNYLHSEGFYGQGMLIAVLDAGFDNAREIESLAHIWEDGRVLATRDFVKDNHDMFHEHIHGTLVLSILAGAVPGNMHGSATGASYILVRTENGSSEHLVEEYNWVAGAEFADSMGADIINSSLGYYHFDFAKNNHSYADMDGKTTPVTRGAAMAARKGILVVNSAGNEGDNEWLHIIAPADADSILAVGAVDTLGLITPFSSRGFSSDGRVKPDVCAVGRGTIGQISAGNLYSCSGTSCSAPIIAGLAACLWQSVPGASTYQLRNAIVQSSNRYTFPDNAYGYGLPDFAMAKALLSAMPASEGLTSVGFFPNPVTNVAVLQINMPWIDSDKMAVLEIFDLYGREILIRKKLISPSGTIFPVHETQFLAKGFYFLRVSLEGRNYCLSFVKI
ncbi:MAG: S8 family serine peptidase [Bacteroidales bacterium]|nr:S8 family serine peptidase [Bacteroidales bacterium]